MVPSWSFTGPIRQYEVGLFAGIRIIRTLMRCSYREHWEPNDEKVQSICSDRFEA